MAKNHYLLHFPSVFFICLLMGSFACHPAETQEKKQLVKVQTGARLFNDLGCVTCHSVTGEKKYGPSLNKLYMQSIDVSEKGIRKTLVADKNYLRQSIINPDFQKVFQFEKNKMPLPNLKPDELECLIEYLASLR